MLELGVYNVFAVGEISHLYSVFHNRQEISERVMCCVRIGTASSSHSPVQIHLHVGYVIAEMFRNA